MTDGNQTIPAPTRDDDHSPVETIGMVLVDEGLTEPVLAPCRIIWLARFNEATPGPAKKEADA